MNTSLNWKKLLIPAVILLIAGILTPLLSEDVYLIHLIIMVFVWGAVATNWNLTLGFGGMFHIAQISFVAVGGYFYGISAGLWGLPPLVSLLVGGVFAALVGLIIGIPSLRVRDVYLILLTFSFHFALKEMVDHFRDITGGSMGMLVEPLSVNGASFELTENYYFAFGLLILVLICNVLILRSHTGSALVAMRDSEVLAKSSGINPFKYKLVTFVFSAFLTGVVGAFYASYLSVVGPEIFAFSLIVNVMSMVIIGGIGTLFGPLLGSVVITLFMEIFSSMDTIRPILVGVVTMLVLLFAPAGLINVGKLFRKRSAARLSVNPKVSAQN